ncbi:glycosyltransferase family 2 protein [Labrys sp. 22185]|uniref:glycosyltransferase family 2 protein n=1 Tax=Labrys sp. 22185 TaxID=3453888 RepID=UPI003F84BB25
MQVDVIMPVRNGATWIAEAIRSLQHDSSAIGRIIVIDDGSTDDSAAIAGGMNENNKVLVVRRPPLGLVAALNYGLRLATTPFVARMDADDLSLPGRLEAQARFLTDNPGIDVVGTQMTYIDARGLPLANQTSYPDTSQSVANALFAGRCVVSHPSVMMRRDTILAFDGYRSAFQASEDYDLWLRVAERGRITNLPETYLRYRLHDAQTGESNKLRQSFSRDLALLCSVERRKGNGDPLAGYSHAPDYDPADPAFNGAPAIVQDLARAYRAINAMRAGAAIKTKDVSIMPQLASFGLLGEGRRSRARILKRAFRCAVATRDWPSTLSTMGCLLRLRASRAPDGIMAARLMNTDYSVDHRR